MAKVTKRVGKKSGKAYYLVDFRDLDGRRRKERFHRERDAKARLAEVLEKRRTGELRARADDITLEQLADDWKLAVAPNVRPQTLKDYARWLDRFILPALGKRKLLTIQVRDVERLRAEVQERAKTGHAAKDGRVTTNHVLGVLGRLLNYAEKHSYIARNPARHVAGIKAPFDERRKKIDGNILAPDEMRQLFQHADGMAKPLLMVAGLCGLRRGELYGLQWGDVELNAAKLHVRRSAARGVLGLPKSPSAMRTLPLPPDLVHELKKWKLACPKGEHDLVFPSANGRPFWSHTHFKVHSFEPALRRAGLRRITLHDLRHSYASMLIASGVSIKVAQRLLGHANVQLTLNLYSHVLPDDTDPVAAVLQERVFGAG